MSSARKIVNGVYWTTIYNIVNTIFGFVSVPILINYFGKAEYGLIGLAMSVNVYMRLMDLGADSTNVRFFSSWLAKDETDKLRSAFSTSLSFYSVVGVLNALVLLVVAIFAGSIFNVSPEQCDILRQLLFVLMLAAIVNWLSSSLNQLVKATENVAWLQMAQLVPKCAQIIILVLTVCLKFGIVLYFLLTSLSVVLLIPLTAYKIKKEIPSISFIPKVSWPILKELLPYCLNIFSFSIFQFSFFNLRPIFLGIRGTMESVADFRILNAVITAVMLFSGSFLGILLPSSSRVVAQENKEGYYKIAYDGTRYISIILCLCCFGLMSVGRELITLYVGESFLYLLPWLNIWLICSLAIHNQAISSLILAGTDIRALAWCSAVASITGLTAAWFLIPKYDIGGVVIAYIVYSVIQAGFYYFYYWPKKMQIKSSKVFVQDFIPFVIAGLLSFLSVVFIKLPLAPVFGFFIKGGAFIIVYAVLVFVFLGNRGRSELKNDVSHLRLKSKKVS